MDVYEMMKNKDGFVISDFDMPKDIQKKASQLCFEYNQLPPSSKDKKSQILKSLFGTCSDLTFVEPNFKCDYGINIHTHGLTFINWNCVMLDTSTIDIGKNCFIAPNVVIACAGHSLDPIQRGQGVLTSKPIYIGENVWIGANSTILGGVSIGNNTVIGAGSLVNKNIPSGVVAVGNPCHVIRKITEKDKLELINTLKDVD